jgi:hypothetical protein
MLAENDAEVREFNKRLEDVAGFLAAERGDLATAVRELSIALGEVADFVRDNREVLHSNVDRLTDVTAVLVKQRNALAEVLDVAPAALGNLALAYNPASGTLDTRALINELTLPAPVLACMLVERTAPTPEQLKQLGDLPVNCENILAGLEAFPLPSAADVITSLQSGQLPPVPGLALPIEPAAPTGPLGLGAPAGEGEQARPTGPTEEAEPSQESDEAPGLGGLLGGDR